MSEQELIEAPVTAVVEYSQTAAALAELDRRFKGVVFDVTTTKGDKEARQARMELTRLRTSLESKRKEIKAPILERSKLIDTEAARITGLIEALENPIDQQIKAEEQRKEVERQEKQRLEEERVAGLVARVNAIRAMAHGALAMKYEELQALAKRVSEVVVGEDFAEFTTAANRARAETFEALKDMAAAAFEAEERQRKRDAEQAALAEANRIEQARLAEERKHLAEERAAAKKADAEQARIAKEAADKLKAEREAFEKVRREAEAAAAPKPEPSPPAPPPAPAPVQQTPVEPQPVAGPKCPHCGGILNLGELQLAAAALGAS